jgi:uncharacterized membrane protein YsdA (DUF1294 family)
VLLSWALIRKPCKSVSLWICAGKYEPVDLLREDQEGKMVLFYYFIWVIVLSLITFILYGLDKARSKTGGWRVPELTFHWLALLGGFPGGWAGRSIFRHKTQKGIFVFVLLVSTLIHIGVGYWLIYR